MISIQAILFDVGGTLRANITKDQRDYSTIRGLMDFLGEDGDPAVFIEKIQKGESRYRKWCQKSLLELTEADLWSQFLLPDKPVEFIRENAIKINQMWRDSRLKNILPDAVETIRELATRGYVLGVISNTTSSVEAPRMLEEHGISKLFSVTLLSTVYGRRKPHPSIFLEASRAIGIPAHHCAYVGDRPSRDVVGARQAGFGEVVMISHNGSGHAEADVDEGLLEVPTPAMQPDYTIHSLSELLKIYPAIRHSSINEQNPYPDSSVLYDAALSTMWSVGQKMPFNQTFVTARQAGFARFELNHQVTPELYSQWDRNLYYISTVHDPCPAIYLNDDLKQNDYMISSLDENCRRKGVDLAKRTIEVACELGARSVVLHPGMIMCDWSRENRLRELFEKGLKGTQEYEVVRNDLIAHRNLHAPAHFDQVQKSLVEIVNFARPTGIEVGLENRYHYYDIPLLEEMQVLLDICDEDWWGFQYDCGHAQTLDALGLCNHKDWLLRYSRRMIGCHLHDVRGIRDHQMPGVGEVDFRMIAAYLPDTALRTLEVSPRLSIFQLKQGMETLCQAGCVQSINILAEESTC